MSEQPSGLPPNFEHGLRSSGREVLAGYLHPRPVELFRKKHPPLQAVDLDVVLLQPDGRSTRIDFAIPDLGSFIRTAAQGQLSLNGRTYSMKWLELADSAQIIETVFKTHL